MRLGQNLLVLLQESVYRYTCVSNSPESVVVRMCKPGPLAKRLVLSNVIGYVGMPSFIGTLTHYIKVLESSVTILSSQLVSWRPYHAPSSVDLTIKL